MITVRAVGHIKSALGCDELRIPAKEIEAKSLIDEVRKMVPDGVVVGFNPFNTLIVINDGEAFTAASATRRLRDGDVVLLVPSSHGG